MSYNPLMAATEKVTMEEGIANRLSGWKTVLDSVASATKLITGPLFALGGGTYIAYLNASVAAKAAAVGAAAAGSAATTASMLFPISIGLLAVGVASLLTALATSYIASSIDKVSIEERDKKKASVAAKALVQELKSNSLCLATETVSERVDGKSWSDVAKSQEQNPNQPCM